LPNNEVMAIIVDNNNLKWVGTYNGLATFDGINWTIKNPYNYSLPNNYINSIAIDLEGYKWFATGSENTVLKFDGENWIVFKMPHDILGSADPISFAVDKKNIIWVGTYRKGAFKIDGTRVIDLRFPQASGIGSISVDNFNNKWFPLMDFINTTILFLLRITKKIPVCLQILLAA